MIKTESEIRDEAAQEAFEKLKNERKNEEQYIIDHTRLKEYRRDNFRKGRRFR